MKKPTHYLEITVHEPCRESWSNMQAGKTGRHCTECRKIVRDFTQVTQDELVDFFRSQPQDICGRFRPDQLNRPFIFKPLTENPSTGKWRSAALISGLIFGGGTAAGQVPLDTSPLLTVPEAPTEIEEVQCFTLGEPKVRNERVVNGLVTDETGEPLIGAHIILVGTSWATVSDFDGEFRLSLPDSLEHFAFIVSHMGYITQTFPVDGRQLGNQTPVHFQLEQESYKLDEIVVKGENPDLLSDNYYLGGTLGFTYIISAPHPEPVEEKLIDNTLVAFPNPFRDAVNLRFQAPRKGMYQIQLMDPSGHLLEQYATHFLSGEHQIPADFKFSGLNSGAYLLRLVGPDDETWIRRIIRQ